MPFPPFEPTRDRLPRWLKRRIPKGNAGHFTSKLIERLDLATVCEQAKCPNRMECYAAKTATFMVLGRVCTRNCRFCGVATGKPTPPDPDEPRRVAEATAQLELEHVVVTCVARDDLPDGGAEHFCRTIEAVRGRLDATVEVLPSDFAGNRDAVDRVVDARPDVYNHNTETVPRLFKAVRNPRADYGWTLEMFRRIRRRAPAIGLKTGLLVGLGETDDELLDTLAELHDAGCRMLTLGQYLRPSLDRVPVVRYVAPEEFQALGEAARRIGYAHVASGPFVRSSYHAREMMVTLQASRP